MRWCSSAALRPSSRRQQLNYLKFGHVPTHPIRCLPRRCHMNPSDSDASRFKSATTDRRGEQDLDDLLVHVARGDQEAFEAVYDRLVGPVYGVTRRVLRDPSHSEEVTRKYSSRCGGQPRGSTQPWVARRRG